MANQYVVTRESLVKALTTGELELEEAIKGGPGSGFHGHVGRAGERGGSAPKGTPATRKRPEHLAEQALTHLLLLHSVMLFACRQRLFLRHLVINS